MDVFEAMEKRRSVRSFDPDRDVPYAGIPADVVRCDKHVDLARQMACESMVLLKNDGVLPLSRALNHVTVIGPNASNDVALYANYCGMSPQMVTPLDGIVGRLSVGSQITYREGCHLWHIRKFTWGILKRPI